MDAAHCAHRRRSWRRMSSQLATTKNSRAIGIVTASAPVGGRRPTAMAATIDTLSSCGAKCPQVSPRRSVHEYSTLSSNALLTPTSLILARVHCARQPGPCDQRTSTTQRAREETGRRLRTFPAIGPIRVGLGLRTVDGWQTQL